MEIINMTSTNYSTLENLLINQKWKEADEETLSIMLSILPNPQQPKLIGDMSEFPCPDLQKIDQLWVSHSQGKFGFSVQKNIWESLKSELDQLQPFDETLFNESFATKIGWIKEGNLLTPEQLDYSLNAPEGQLPAKWVNDDFIAGKTNIDKTWQRLNLCLQSTSPSSPNSNITPQKLDEAIGKLTTQLTNEFNFRKDHHKSNRTNFLALSIASIVFTCLATIFGIIGNIDTGESSQVVTGQTTTQVIPDDTKLLGIKRTDLWKFLTPICTTIAATLQAAVLGFPVQQRAKHHRTLAAQTDALKSELEIQQFLGISPEYLQKISHQLSQIKLTSANEDGETNGQISTLTLEQINAAVAEMTKLKTELENLKKSP